MNTKIALKLIAISLPLFLLAACGDSDTAASQTGALITWSAGELDFFGCPYVDPEPWDSLEVHEEVCGVGCMPIAANGPVFVACISEEMPLPEAGADVIVCLTDPVTRTEYTFPNRAWLGMTEVCWGVCEDADAPLPEGCYEDD